MISIIRRQSTNLCRAFLILRRRSFANPRVLLRIIALATSRCARGCSQRPLLRSLTSRRANAPWRMQPVLDLILASQASNPRAVSVASGLLRRGAPRNDGRRLRHLQPALLLDEARDLLDALAGAQVGEHERARATHAFRFAIHRLERGPDIGREIDFVDHKEIRTGDARSAFRG